MSQNEISFFLVLTSLLVAIPPMLFAENNFGNDIRQWIPDHYERERFFYSGGFTAVAMTGFATLTFLFETTRSISAVLFLGTVIVLGVSLLVAEADGHKSSHLLVHVVYTSIYFLAGIALLYSYGFDFSIDTPWVLSAVLSSLIIGVIVGGLLTTTDPEEKGTLINALLAYIALCLLVVGIYTMTINMPAGLLIVGIVVVASGIAQHVIDDPWAVLTTIIGIILLGASAVGFIINLL
jgi:hypothetical protein